MHSAGLNTTMTSPDARASLGYQLAFLSDITLENIARNLWTHRRALITLKPRYLPRLLGLTALSAAMTPLRLWERLRWHRTLSQTTPAPPLFVLGHWRSGTTHLHNLLSTDPALGHLPMVQAVMPGSFLSFSALAKLLFDHLLPATRPMDQVSWTMETPQEEEIALSKWVPEAFFTHLMAPQLMAERFESQILLGHTPGWAERRWQRAYRTTVQKAAVWSQGRRLVLKNPANTGRIHLLLQMYPQGRFVFIHRNPYAVFVSMRRFYDTLFALLGLQPMTAEQRDDLILTGYEALMRRYLTQRTQIPAGHLVEVRFDELERTPTAIIHDIRRRLDMKPLGDAGQTALQKHLDGVKGYRKNTLPGPEPQALAQINARWAFAFDTWGWPTRQP